MWSSTPVSWRPPPPTTSARSTPAVQHDPDIQAFVEKLEAAASEEDTPDTFELPSGDSIERELQRFLRQRGQEPPK